MRSRIAVAATLVVILLGAPGCYFRKYEKLARTHADILVAMTAKLEDVTARDGTPPGSLVEYRYPLERAEDFADIAARRFDDRASLRALRALCAAYGRLLDAADRTRASMIGGSPPPSPTLAATADEVRAAAATVTRELDREHAG
jgi:hypothetical protein